MCSLIIGAKLNRQ